MLVSSPKGPLTPRLRRAATHLNLFLDGLGLLEGLLVLTDGGLQAGLDAVGLHPQLAQLGLGLQHPAQL